MILFATPAADNPLLLSIACDNVQLGYLLLPLALPNGAYPIGLGFAPPAGCLTAFILAVPGTEPDAPIFLDPGCSEPNPHPLAVRGGKQLVENSLHSERVMFNELLWMLSEANTTEPLALLVSA